MSRVSSIVFCCFFSLICGGSAVAADTLLGFTYDSWLVTLLPGTGAVTEYHVQLPVYGGRVAAYDPLSGTIYAGGNAYGTGESVLFRIDPKTLAVGSVGLTGRPNSGYVDSFAVDPRSGSLYAALYDFTDSEVVGIDPATGVETLVRRFPGISLAALTFDVSTGALYGIANPGGTQNPPQVVRIDLASGVLTTVYRAKAAYAFRSLAVIPGTMSFYTETGETFARIDAAAGTVTPLGHNDSITDQIAWQDFAVSPRPVPEGSNGNLRYTAEDACFPVVCLASVLNDEGTLAGPASADAAANAIFIQPHGSGIRYVSGTDVQDIPLSMNNRGDIVGYTWGIDPGATRAFLYSAAADRFYPLDLFDGQYGKANYINNHGQIIGNKTYFTQYAFGLNADYLSGLTDSGILLGHSRGAGFVIDHFSTVFTENAYPEVFNNAGEFLSSGGGGLTGDAVLYRPGTGLRVLPGNTGQFRVPVGLNDAGLALFRSQEGPGARLFDTSGTIPELSAAFLNVEDLVAPKATWSDFRAVAINNAGQIAVLATNVSTGRRTTLLLTPQTATGLRMAGRSVGRMSLKKGTAADFTFNGAGLGSRGPAVRQQGR